MFKSLNKVFIIAEAGVNHNGRLDLALKLCDEAKKTGADAIKFQTWKTDKIITKDVKKADYQNKGHLKSKSQYEMLKELELSYKEFNAISDYCSEIGLKFLSTADEEFSLKFLLSLGVELIKIGSGDIDNVPFLRKIGETKLPVILSTGMSTLSDVETAINILTNSGTSYITLLHCTTSYPCPFADVNLNAMLTLKSAFGYPVGYSDHTLGIEVPIAAVAMGASVIEKHFTLNRKMDGPDHYSSLGPSEFTHMVKAIRNTEIALGSGIKRPGIKEVEIGKVVKKKIVASKRISKGEIFTEKNLTVKRSNSGIPASYWDYVIGIKSPQVFRPDQPITL